MIDFFLKSGQDSDESDINALPPWMVTYSDLISQLLVFFIMFFSITKAKQISELEEALEVFQKKEKIVDREFKPGEVVLRLPSRVLFDSGKAELKPLAFPSLDKAYRMIRENMMKYGVATIRIEGHTDNVPIHTARFPSNWELSTARAISVVRYFREKGYFEPEEMQAMGYGEHKPIDTNDTPEGREKNRRVVIKIVRTNITPQEQTEPASEFSENL